MKIHRILLASVVLSLLSVIASPAQEASATNATSPATPATNHPPNVQAPPGANEKAKSISLLAIGAPAPDFVSKDMDGKEVKLSDFRDKVVVLDFWATWCGPCKASLPHTQEAAKNYKNQGVVVLAVCTSDTRAKFEEFIKAHREQYPDIHFASDPHEKGSSEFPERASRALYGLKSIPTQFIIGRNGKIADVIVGFDEKDHRLEEALDKLLKSRPAQSSPGAGSKPD